MIRSSGRNWFHAAAFIGLAAFAAIALTPSVRSQSPPSTGPQYTPDGQLKVPVGYQTWVFVGSNLGLAYRPELEVTTAAETARATQQLFHNVYIDPDAYAYFLVHKEFPDRTVLVMDIFTAADREPRDVLAAGVYNDKQIGLQVAVKNANRPDGKTTPWAYYILQNLFDPQHVLHPSAPAKDDPDCEACHKVNASKDHVWVQFYPTLRKVMP